MRLEGVEPVGPEPPVRRQPHVQLPERLGPQRVHPAPALRPRPHQFGAFHVLRLAGVPAVLVEAGYLSNVDDEAKLVTPAGRKALVDVLASAIEAEAALQRR